MASQDEAGFCRGRNLRRGKSNVIEYRDPKKPDRRRITKNQLEILQKLSLGWRLTKGRLSAGLILSKAGQKTKNVQDRVALFLVEAGLLIVSTSGPVEVYSLVQGKVSTDASLDTEEE